MEQLKIDRINELARKSRVTELSTEEKEEQAILRQVYRDGFIRNLTGQLENITIVDEQGNKKKITKKD